LIGGESLKNQRLPQFGAPIAPSKCVKVRVKIRRPPPLPAPPTRRGVTSISLLALLGVTVLAIALWIGLPLLEEQRAQLGQLSLKQIPAVALADQKLNELELKRQELKRQIEDLKQRITQRADSARAAGQALYWRASLQVDQQLEEMQVRLARLESVARRHKAQIDEQEKRRDGAVESPGETEE
jgi:hypothetical protein